MQRIPPSGARKKIRRPERRVSAHLAMQRFDKHFIFYTISPSAIHVTRVLDNARHPGARFKRIMEVDD